MATPMSIGTFVPLFAKSQWFTTIPVPQTSFAGQTIIITGANTGLGYEAARHLVRLGVSKLIIAVRTISKGEAAAAELIASTKATRDVIEVWPLDLSDPESIKAFGARVNTLDRLDGVIQNAGMASHHWKTIAGHEAHVAVNVIGAMLVGLSVLPKLRESATKFGTQNRLTFVGSDTYYFAQFKEANTQGSLLAALDDEAKVNQSDRYPTSKLLIFYAVRELATRSPITLDSNVIINVMTPGLCRSDLMRETDKLGMKIFEFIFMGLFARKTEVGGRTLVHAVSTDLPGDAHGKFIMDCKVTEDGSNIASERAKQIAKNFNDELFAELEVKLPGVTKCLA